MSLFTRLYPDKCVEDVLRSSSGILAAQSVQQAISEVFPLLWSNYSMVELKGKLMIFTIEVFQSGVKTCHRTSSIGRLEKNCYNSGLKNLVILQAIRL